MSTAAPDVAPKTSVVETTLFDILKVLALIVLPALATAYWALASGLNLPAPEAVVGGLTSAAAALGTFVKTSEVKYNASDAKFDGVVNVVQTDAKKLYQLALKYDPNLIDQAEQIVLKVVKPQPTSATSTPVTIAEAPTVQPTATPNPATIASTPETATASTDSSGMAQENT